MELSGHRLATLTVLALALASGALLSTLAIMAGIGQAAPFDPRTSCVTPEFGAQNLAGDVNHVVTGFEHNGSELTIEVRNEGTDASDMPFATGRNCSGPDWNKFTADVGDRGDVVRMDARGLTGGLTALSRHFLAIVNGGSGPDRLLGHIGVDRSKGGTGDDLLKGFGGGDRLEGGPDSDTLIGAGGGDRLFAKDGRKDRVRCGGGTDRATVDHKDDVSGCEHVHLG